MKKTSADKKKSMVDDVEVRLLTAQLSRKLFGLVLSSQLATHNHTVLQN